MYMYCRRRNTHHCYVYVYVYTWREGHKVQFILAFAQEWLARCEIPNCWQLSSERVSLDATSSKCMPPPQKCIWFRYDLDLWPVTFKTFSVTPAHVTYICAQFHSEIPPPLCTEISRHVKYLLTDVYTGRMDGRKLMAIHQPEKCVWPRFDLDLWPLPLKNFSAVPTHLANIWAKARALSAAELLMISRFFCTHYVALLLYLWPLDLELLRHFDCHVFINFLQDLS